MVLGIDVHHPEARALGARHQDAAHRHVGAALDVRADHGAIIHLVNVVARQDDHVAGARLRKLPLDGRHAVDPVHHRDLGLGVQRRRELEVGPRREEPVAAGEHDRRRLVGGQLLLHRHRVGEQLAVHRVGRRAVQPHERDLATGLDVDVAGHGGSLVVASVSTAGVLAHGTSWLARTQGAPIAALLGRPRTPRGAARRRQTPVCTYGGDH